MPNLITLTGPSGSGKSEIMKIIETENSQYKVLPKYTTRERRKDDDETIITVDKIPDECNLVYEQYGKEYGISSRMITQYLQQGKVPVVVVNDVKVIETLQAKFGTSMKSYFIHRGRPSREKLIEIYKKTRGEVEPETIEKRYEVAHKIYSMYTDRIILFDNIILNTGEGFEEAKSIVKQILDSASDQKRLLNLQGNKIFVIAGSPGSGKDILVQSANDLGCLQIPKYTDRDRKSDDGSEMIFKEDAEYHLDKCKLQYMNYGNKYGIDTQPIWENLIMTNKHQILVCSDPNILRKLKNEFCEAIVSIYVHSDVNIAEFEKIEQQNGSLDNYIRNRIIQYNKAHKNYAENFAEYDKSLIYTGNKRELLRQFAGILGIPYKEQDKQMEGETK